MRYSWVSSPMVVAFFVFVFMLFSLKPRSFVQSLFFDIHAPRQPHAVTYNCLHPFLFLFLFCVSLEVSLFPTIIFLYHFSTVFLFVNLFLFFIFVFYPVFAWLVRNPTKSSPA